MEMQETMSKQCICEGLQVFYSDPSNINIWENITRFVQESHLFEGPISDMTSKSIDNLIQKCKEVSQRFNQFLKDHKVMLGNIYELITEEGDSIDEFVSSGNVKKLVHEKFEEKINLPMMETVSICVELLVIHVLQRLQKYEGVSGKISQEGNLFIDRRKFMRQDQLTLIQQVFSRPICGLTNFMDSAKFCMKNYINLLALLDIQKEGQGQKCVLIKGLMEKKGCEEGQLPQYYKIGKVFEIKKIINTEVKEAQFINKQLDYLSLPQLFFNSKKENKNEKQKWSLVSCVNEEGYKFKYAYEKLPLFLRPKSNTDVLSYLREEVIPTFRLYLIQPGFWQGPVVSEFVTVYYNFGHSPVTFISIQGTSEEIYSYSECHNFHSVKQLQKKGLKYGKITIKPQGIAVIPIGNVHFIYVDEKELHRGELVQWKIVPKYGNQVNKFLTISEKKAQMYGESYFQIPKWLLLLDFVNHEFNSLKKHQLEGPMKMLEEHLKMEEIKFCNLLKNTKNLEITQQQIPYRNRYCNRCFKEILNYYVIAKSGLIVCLSCGYEEGSILEAKYIFDEKALYFPIILWKLLIENKKLLFKQEYNTYENEICNDEFVGCITQEACSGSKAVFQKIENHIMNNMSGQKLFYKNLIREMYIVDPETAIIEKVVKKPETEKEKKELLKEIEFHARWVHEKEELIKKISKSYEKGGLVLEGMWILQKYLTTNQ